MPGAPLPISSTAAAIRLLSRTSQRVDFGYNPGGGSCDCSGDGSKLAFIRTLADGSGSVTGMMLTWLDLRDLQTVHQPAPELTNIGFLDRSPALEILAVFGCQADQQACGLYRFDPTTGQLNLLVPGIYTAWVPIWSPDGSQIAFVDNFTENLFVADIQTGEIAYQGKFDTQGWKAPAGSPTHQWGAEFPRGMYGSRCFESPWEVERCIRPVVRFRLR